MSEPVPQQDEDPTTPSILYHYTNQDGLYGILGSSCLWATHYLFLNDLSERKEALALFSDAISRQMVTGPSTNLVKEKVKAIKNYLAVNAKNNLNNVHHGVDTYYVSFTNEDDNPGDLLSQWRGYAQGHQGFSLGFNPERLMGHAERLQRDAGLNTPPYISHCIYGDDYKKAIVDTISGKNVRNRENLVFCMAQFKHIGFAEEKEYRLVLQVPADQTDLNLIKFRDGTFGRTPFIEVPLELQSQDSPLERIVVGPSQYMDQTVRSLKIELRKMGLSGIEVAASRIPYRNC